MIDIIMPKWGLTMEEGTVVQWLRQVGETVAAGDLLVEVESDKATGEVESPAAGRLAEILVEPGAVVQPGEVIGRIAPTGGA